MSTYANIKMGEIFVIYGNPFSRKNWKKNIKQVLCIKYYKRVNFTSYLVYNANVSNVIPLKHFKDSLSLINNNSHQLYLNKIFAESHQKKFSNLTLQEKDTINNMNKFKTSPNNFNNINQINITTIQSQKLHFNIETNKSSANISKNQLWSKISQFDDKFTYTHDKKDEIEETNEANSVDKTNDLVFDNNLKMNSINEENNKKKKFEQKGTE